MPQPLKSTRLTVPRGIAVKRGLQTGVCLAVLIDFKILQCPMQIPEWNLTPEDVSVKEPRPSLAAVKTAAIKTLHFREHNGRVIATVPLRVIGRG
jgi:hypothetical protein